MIAWLGSRGGTRHCTLRARHAIRSSGSVVNGIVDRPTLRSHQRRLETPVAHSMSKSPSIGRSRFGTAVVFLEGGLSPIPMANGEHPFHRGPRLRVCQLAHCRIQRPAPKRNSLLNLDFLGLCDTVRFKDNKKQLPKTNHDNRQKTNNGTR